MFNYTEEQFNGVKALIEEAHEHWGDHTGSGVTLAVLDFLFPQETEEERKRKQQFDEQVEDVVRSAPNYVQAIKNVRALSMELLSQTMGLRDARMIVDRIAPEDSRLFNAWTGWKPPRDAYCS